MKINKKAQIETIGLVVIIILLVTIGFIFISLIGRSPKTEISDTSTTALKQAIIKTKTQDINIKQLISDSYTSKNYQDLRDKLTLILNKFPKNKYSIKILANNQEFFQLNPCEGIVTSSIFTQNNIKYIFTLVKCNTL